MRFLGPIKNSNAMPKFYNISCYIISGFPGGSDGKASARTLGDPGSIPGSGRSLEKEMAIHSGTLAWKIPWTEEPDRLQFMESQLFQGKVLFQLKFVLMIE